MRQFCPNEKATITIKEILTGNEKQVDSKAISIEGNDDRGSIDFLLKADDAGLKHYRISLSTLSNEASTANNVKDVFIEVEEKKEKVLILANAPHPDVAALKQAIEETKNYHVDVNIGSDFNGSIENYSLFIFDQLPAQGSPVQELLDRIHKEKKSILYILGAQTSISMLNNAQQMLSIQGNNGSTTRCVAHRES